MTTSPFPRARIASIHELAAQVLERRGPAATPETLAADMLAGFSELCARAGLDGLLAGLALDEPAVQDALGARLGDKAAFDPRGPRNAKPKQLADCLIATLGLEPEDPPDRTITLTADLRAEVAAAMAKVIDPALEPAALRAAIIASARAACEERHHKAFDKIAAELDERGLRAPSPPKLPLDAVAAVQKALSEARTALFARVGGAALDAARDTIARVDADAAARLDAPITLRLTPRDVAIARADEARVPKTPEAFARSLFDTITELAHLAWPAAEQAARPYAASATFAVGELVDHPKFGRGTVKTSGLQRIEVEFAEGTHTLVHARR